MCRSVWSRPAIAWGRYCAVTVTQPVSQNSVTETAKAKRRSPENTVLTIIQTCSKSVFFKFSQMFFPLTTLVKTTQFATKNTDFVRESGIRYNIRCSLRYNIRRSLRYNIRCSLRYNIRCSLRYNIRCSLSNTPTERLLGRPITLATIPFLIDDMFLGRAIAAQPPRSRKTLSMLIDCMWSFGRWLVGRRRGWGGGVWKGGGGATPAGRHSIERRFADMIRQGRYCADIVKVNDNE